MTIDEIYRNGEISLKSYNVCKYNELHSVRDLKTYLYEKKGLKKIQKRCKEELIEVCINYQGISTENRVSEAQKINSLKQIVSELTRIQREVINSFILVNTNSLSVRVKNAIYSYLEDNLKIKNFAEKIFISGNFVINDIKNVGSKSIPELEIYLEIVRDFLLEVSESKNEKHLISLKNSFLIQRTFKLTKIPIEILESELIFLLTNFLLNQNVLFDKTQTEIVKKTLKIYQNSEELMLDDIALEINLSRERVRQIRKSCIDELFNKLLFTQNFNDDLLQNYNIDTNANLIEINLETVKTINFRNGLDLSREFITYILFSYLCNNFLLIGDIEDVLYIKNSKGSNRHIWSNFYLIKKNIVSEIDFKSLVDDINSRLAERINESYSFNFKSYLSKFLINRNLSVLDRAFPIAENIVNEEFEIYLDLDENIHFERSTSKKVYEYAYEALEGLGKPSKLSCIYKKVLELNSYYQTDENKLRAAMSRKNGFLPVGRKSVFGLKKWEDELDNFKGGTIRRIVEDYLSQFSKPKHISDITNHVLKYRPKSNQNSILQNLKLDESNIYVFYVDSFIGLSNKQYDKSFIKVSELQKENRKNWKESLEVLNNFINKEKRLPYSSGCPESEKRLHRWFGLQKRKCANGRLRSENKKLILEISDKFSETIEKQKKTKYSLSELINFIEDQKRMPSSKLADERSLYKFYYKNKKVIEKNSPSTSDEHKLFELIAKYGRSNLSKYSIVNLIDFIIENQRIPSSKLMKERKLYKFYYKNKKVIEKNSPSTSDEHKLFELIAKYGRSNFSKYSIADLIDFIIKNQRMPDSRLVEERKLYQFYYKNKKALVEKNPSTSQEYKLVELIAKYGRSHHAKYSILNLIDFIIENQRMPDSRLVEERKLYQFYYKNKKTLEKNSPSTSHEHKLVELIAKYGRSKLTKYSIANLIDFIIENRRMPDSRLVEERKLYQFYYKQQRLYKKDDLEPEEIIKFEKVLKLIQNMKYENKRN